jgi:LEA14-like dessication related protein
MKTILAVTSMVILLASCKNVIRPEFEHVEKFRLGKMGLSESTVTVDLRFRNPNTFGLRLKSLDFEVSADGTNLGHFHNASMVRIPANSSFSVPLEGQIRTLAMASQTKKAAQGEQSIIHLTGVARVGKTGFYKSFPIDYTDTLVLDLNSRKKTGDDAGF